jgi:hypothetical protein
MFGIILGAMTIKYFGVSRINWIYKKPKPHGDSDTKYQYPIYKAISKLKPDVLI